MKKRVLILGCSGMLGHMLFTRLSSYGDYDVYGAMRTPSSAPQWFSPELVKKIKKDVVDADNFDSVIRALASIQPQVVINCVGLIKQLPLSTDPLSAITVNSLLPHRISLICRAAGARMIHISTDCVFSGDKGNYTESDQSDAKDLYGRSKFLGEVEYSHCVTLRTSIIGHELKGKHGLIEWFLAQEGKVRGFSNAIFSGFTTIELTKIISDYVLPNAELKGVYHVSSNPVSKYDLLKMVAERYGKNVEIEKYDDFRHDKSLDSTKFRLATGYKPPTWPDLIDKMYQDYKTSPYYKK